MNKALVWLCNLLAAAIILMWVAIVVIRLSWLK